MRTCRTFSIAASIGMRLVFAVCLLAAPAAVLLSPAAAHAQQKQRMVDGTVHDANGSPVSGAIVYLKNTASLTVKTYVTTADGTFRFGQVGMDADFQVWAESGGKKSPVKTISSFDSKQKWTIPLKLPAK